MQFGTWLSALRGQESIDGVDHYELACYASKLTPYVRGNLDDALGLLASVSDDIPDGVSDDDLRAYWEENRSAYIRKIREVLDHIGAALTAVGCTDKQLELAAKSDEENETGTEIQESSGRVCAMCTKSLDEMSVEPLVLHENVLLCGSEECEDRYDGIETIRISVDDVVRVTTVGRDEK